MVATKAVAVKKTVKKATSLTIPVIGSGPAKKDGFAVSEAIFNVVASPKLLSQYVRVYLDRARSSRAKAQTRAEVRGSSRKIYRQKGTGRARHGDRQAPIFVGGGKAHGPKGISRILTINKKQRQKALLYALSLKLKNNSIYMSPQLEKVGGKTKEILPILANVEKRSGSILIVLPDKNSELLVRSISNIGNIRSTSAQNLNAYEVMQSETILFSPSGLAAFMSLREKKS